MTCTFCQPAWWHRWSPDSRGGDPRGARFPGWRPWAEGEPARVRPAGGAGSESRSPTTLPTPPPIPPPPPPPPPPAGANPSVLPRPGANRAGTPAGALELGCHVGVERSPARVFAHPAAFLVLQAPCPVGRVPGASPAGFSEVTETCPPDWIEGRGGVTGPCLPTGKPGRDGPAGGDVPFLSPAGRSAGSRCKSLSLSPVSDLDGVGGGGPVWGQVSWGKRQGALERGRGSKCWRETCFGPKAEPVVDDRPRGHGPRVVTGAATGSQLPSCVISSPSSQRSKEAAQNGWQTFGVKGQTRSPGNDGRG